LKINEYLHGALASEAAKTGISLNLLVAEKLKASVLG